jgi:hypothetical protein
MSRRSWGESPMGPFHNTFDEALDDLIEDWAGDESDEDIVSALIAKADEMQVVPPTTVSEEKHEESEEEQG